MKIVTTILALVLALFASQATAQELRQDTAATEAYLLIDAVAVMAPVGNGPFYIAFTREKEDTAGAWDASTPKVVTVPAGFTRARITVVYERALPLAGSAGLILSTLNGAAGAAGFATSAGGDGPQYSTATGYWIPVVAGSKIRLAFDLFDEQSSFNLIRMAVEFR